MNMNGVHKRITDGLIRGAVVYLVWCYGGFVVGPIAIAWDRVFLIPLWVLVAGAGLAPLVIEAWIVRSSRVTLAPAEGATLWPALTGPFANATTPYRHHGSRLVRPGFRSGGRWNRFRRARLR